MNWITFFNKFFSSHNISVEENAGHWVKYKAAQIYIYCELQNDSKRIRKLEFGRLDDSWVKGVFIKTDNLYVTFLQQSTDGENGEKFTLDYNTDNGEIVSKFLQIPYMIGWTEIEYRLDIDKYYKVVVLYQDSINRRSWNIPLMDIGQQDMPLPGDKWDTWLSSKIGDAFWNKSRRKTTEFKVPPMTRLTETNAQQRL